MDTTEGTALSQVVNINGQDIPLEEAQELIETGRKAREYETTHNTKLDSIYPEYTKLTQERSTWEKEKADYKKELDDFKSKQAAGVETPVDTIKARKAAKELGIVLDEDLNGKYYTKEELASFLDERDQKKAQEKQQVDAVFAEADKIAREVKDSGSPVPFNKKAVIAYAGAYNLTDLRKAYEEMNDELLTHWKESQIASKKSASLKTLNTGGKKTPVEPRVTSDSFKDAIQETLETKNL